ncbi:MAG: SDR family NAD(P)-dependent oxidoreductase [Bacteroidales bacterium]|jgi:short-subunit dehydrogenase involved in D-alanine esterification of teichoic acids|nr:SDR family NAD(P)-dependent oxidoreductase [Bacteroidales bacterium]
MKVLITGGTNGMGKGVAKILAGVDNQLHEVIILCRSKELGVATIKEIENTANNKKISIVICDLTKLRDVRNAIIEIQSQHKYLDGIFINAGLGYAFERVETEDGMDSHFQVNYLSQFMLTLNLLNLLENSENGGRVIFNVTRGGKIFWDDIQMKRNWGFENGIHQAMVAKRMFLVKLNNLYRGSKGSKLSFIGFEISKTVWSNQLNIIPLSMKTMATIMKFFGTFISIEECGKIMAPLFTENQEESLKKSGKFITWKKNNFIEINEDKIVFDHEMQDRLWKTSLELCKDQKTTQIAEKLQHAVGVSCTPFQ